MLGVVGRAIVVRAQRRAAGKPRTCTPSTLGRTAALAWRKRVRVHYAVANSSATVFSQIGSFESTWGSLGDFHWNMRAGLVANTVHVPDTWRGWRNHAEQATARSVRDSSQFSASIEAIVQYAVSERAADLTSAIRAFPHFDLARSNRGHPCHETLSQREAEPRCQEAISCGTTARGLWCGLELRCCTRTPEILEGRISRPDS